MSRIRAVGNCGRSSGHSRRSPRLRRMVRRFARWRRTLRLCNSENRLSSFNCQFRPSRGVQRVPVREDECLCVVGIVGGDQFARHRTRSCAASDGEGVDIAAAGCQAARTTTRTHDESHVLEEDALGIADDPLLAVQQRVRLLVAVEVDSKLGQEAPSARNMTIAASPADAYEIGALVVEADLSGSGILKELDCAYRNRRARVRMIENRGAAVEAAAIVSDAATGKLCCLERRLGFHVDGKHNSEMAHATRARTMASERIGDTALPICLVISVFVPVKT